MLFAAAFLEIFISIGIKITDSSITLILIYWSHNFHNAVDVNYRYFLLFFQFIFIYEHCCIYNFRFPSLLLFMSKNNPSWAYWLQSLTQSRIEGREIITYHSQCFPRWMSCVSILTLPLALDIKGFLARFYLMLNCPPSHTPFIQDKNSPMEEAGRLDEWLLSLSSFPPRLGLHW